MKPPNRTLLTALSVIVLGGSACTVSSQVPVRVPDPGDHDLTLEAAGTTRSFVLHLPPLGNSESPLPLVVAFHGGGGRASGYAEYAGLDAVADRERFAVVYPDGSGRFGRRPLTWNAGGCCGFAMHEEVDDVGFTRALVEEVARLAPIDRRRVYATGHSNGAMMSYRVAAEAPDLVAAIAPVAGAMSLERFEATRPVPVLHVHSVDDPRALYEGGLGPPFPLTRTRVHHNPVEAELQRWISLNGCPPSPVVVTHRAADEAGHTATHLRWAPCESGADIELWKLTGAGHGWPGGDAGTRQRIVGPNTNAVRAADEIWKFFSRFERTDRR